MASIIILIGGAACAASAGRLAVHGARLERLGGLLLVASFVGLGFDLARAAA